MSGLRSLHTMNLFSRFFQENQEKFLAFAYSYLRDKAEHSRERGRSMSCRSGRRCDGIHDCLMGKPRPLGRKQ